MQGEQKRESQEILVSRNLGNSLQPCTCRASGTHGEQERGSISTAAFDERVIVIKVEVLLRNDCSRPGNEVPAHIDIYGLQTLTFNNASNDETAKAHRTS